MTTQVPSRGIDFIIFMGRTKGQKEQPELNLKELIGEGRQIGGGRLDAVYALGRSFA